MKNIIVTIIVLASISAKLFAGEPIIDSKGIILEEFSTQLGQLVCAYKNDFESLKGKKTLQSSDLFFESKIQMKAGLKTEIIAGSVKVDFGRIENDAELIKLFTSIKAKINETSISCAKFDLDKVSGVKELMTTYYSQSWRIKNSPNDEMKNLAIVLTINGHSLKLEIINAADDYLDDDDGW